MEKLNELVEQAKEISSKNWFINSDEEVTAIDKDAGPDDSEEVFIGCAANIQLAKYITSASPETILAIAEAFRALEQENNKLRQRAGLAKEANDFEAKLAELAKQKPAGYGVKRFDNGQFGSWLKSEGLAKGDDDYYVVPLYEHPAPAADLAELVPNRKPVPELGECLGSISHWCDGWNSCRAAILRKIEEAK